MRGRGVEAAGETAELDELKRRLRVLESQITTKKR